MFGDKRCFACGFGVVIAGLIAGCGGRQAPAASPCEDGYNLLMEKGDDALCDSLQVNLFEIQVTKWRDDCPVEAEATQGKSVAEKLDAARVCTEKIQRSEVLQNECESRLAKIATESENCIGETCAPFSKELEDAKKTCDVAELNGALTDEIATVKANLDERTTDAERLTALAKLATLPAEIGEISDKKQAEAAVDKILQTLSESPFLQETPPAASEAERYRQQATVALDTVLQDALSRIIAGYAVILDNPKIKHTSRKWKLELDKLEALDTRLQENEGASLFPEAAKMIGTTIEKYDPKEKQASEEKQAPAAAEKSDAVPAAAAPAAETAAGPKKQLTSAQCKAQQKKVAQFTAKVAEYQKKENPAKVKAYQAKLDTANAALEACGDGEPKAAAATPPPKPESVDEDSPYETTTPAEKNVSSDPAEAEETAKTVEPKKTEG